MTFILIIHPVCLNLNGSACPVCERERERERERKREKEKEREKV